MCLYTMYMYTGICQSHSPHREDCSCAVLPTTTSNPPPWFSQGRGLTVQSLLECTGGEGTGFLPLGATTNASKVCECIDVFVVRCVC